MALPAALARLARALVATRPRQVAAVLLAGLALAGLLRAVLGPEVPAWRVEARPVVQRVVASGRVRPPSRASLGSLVLGRVAAVPAREGDRVAAGQELLRLDDAELAAALRQAEARVAEAAARLEQVRGVAGRVAAEALAQAELRVADAEAAQARAGALAAAGGASTEALDQAERAAAAARSQREAAAAQARSAAAGPDARLATAALQQAQAARAAAAARLEQTRLRAPAPGVVVARAAEPGDVVPAGRELLALAVDGPVELSAHVDEKNLARLAVGLPGEAVADAFPDRPFPCRVTFLSPAVDAARGTVEVRLAVPEPPAFLRADMTVSINVEVGHKASALVVPTEAVRDPSGEPWVLAVAGGRVERRAVTLGLRGDGLVEVVGGLAAGEAVLSPAAGWIEPGARVRARLRALPGAGRAL